MIYIAGKPKIGHFLDRMKDLEMKEVILVVGYKKEQIISYVDENYSGIFNINYVYMDEQIGKTPKVMNSDDMKILVTYGAGFLDSQICFIARIHQTRYEGKEAAWEGSEGRIGWRMKETMGILTNRCILHKK